jgi:tRNA (guanine37-N1)-methyltransferase
MKITIISLFPKMIEGFIGESIIKRAQEKGLVEIEVIDLRKYAIDDYGTVDDRPYGGGAGMVMRIEPVHKALSQVKKNGKETRTVLTSAKGKPYRQEKAVEFSKLSHLIIIAGHYEGVDERVADYVDEEVSLGDFVLTGGEIPAAAVIDSVIRLIPGVLKKEKAVQEESFFYAPIDRLIEAVGEDEVLKKLKDKGVEKIKLLEYPHYTRPEEYEGKKVPPILIGGHTANIENWRLKRAYEITLQKRPDLLKQLY